jgi:hypothetical protein
MDKVTVIARTLFAYDNGTLRNKVSRGKAKSGAAVGTPDAYGYLVATVNGKTHKVHRLIYALFHDVVPDMLDHINGNPADNRIENLRPANHKQNGCNRARNHTNTTGVKGVSRLQNKWIAQCQVEGKRHYLGIFQDLKAAEDRVIEFRTTHHKEFARNG